ncbi:aldehyde dehydrogenase family protein [Williamsia sp. DF01-3]|uniref:aldehyde dehydrogenase family protein n=1 Tax=Williamsia sp. DF01-3 TaxID=2934157 RepID=UPI001FF5057F|nr:aldehyde dehydrogenase family protein [Williamsia sp. DF01-3]MCK0517345.1 aldehyde dehydrogenase family protein [Williamsia sp. DF01-3]
MPADSHPALAPSSSPEINKLAAAQGEHRLLINGELTESSTGESFDNVSPATGEVLGTTSAATASDMQRAIAGARRAFDESSWSTDRDLRTRCLQQLQQALDAEVEDLRNELIAEAGAPHMMTRTAQLDWPLDDGLRFPMQMIKDFEWERTLPTSELRGVRSSRAVRKEPVGVVAAITPWNFPFEIVINKLGPALAAGNSVILKPASLTPWNATRLGRIVAEKTDIPPGVLQVLPTPDASVTEILSVDDRVDMVSFTGSTGVGRRIVEKSAGNLKRTFLELGGKSAMIVLDDAEFATALPHAAQACTHAGQGCALSTRLLVPRARYSEAVDFVTHVFQSLSIGDPADPRVYVGPVISARQRDSILGYIAQGVSEGGQVTTGGTSAPELPDHLSGGFFVSPTVIAGLDNSSTPAREEIFGPVMTVIAYDSEEDAIAIANDSPYGLAGSIFSASTERALAVAHRIRTGSISINGGLYYGADSPYGGYKTSGVGRQNGIEGFEQYLETKSIAWIAHQEGQLHD